MMMFAVEFDSLKRKMLSKAEPVLLKKLMTASVGTEDYNAYMGLFLLPENETIEVYHESDKHTVTFFTIIKNVKEIERELERERERINESYRKSATGGSAGTGAFV